MGNLYEYTNTMQYVRDLTLILEPESATDKKRLKDKLAEYPSGANLIDDYPRQSIAPKSKKLPPKNSSK